MPHPKKKRKKRAGEHQQMPSLSDVDKAYLAGLIDGEGCIGIYSKKPTGTRTVPYHQLMMSVSMMDEGPVEFMACLTASYHSLKMHRLTRTGTCYDVRLYGKRAANFLKQILPYMKGKRDQAEMAIRFYDECYFSNTNVRPDDEEIARRQWFEWQLKEMKHGQQEAYEA
ncbi:MAG: hypothetical protein E3J60_04615 [Dehalococcoidia bacterium]|nr:MAG: hypothetical protein E3J60_04615 [Dehalococcoidia bacterium]